MSFFAAPAVAFRLVADLLNFIRGELADLRLLLDLQKLDKARADRALEPSQNRTPGPSEPTLVRPLVATPRGRC